MYCPKCDMPRPNDVRFCKECGTALIMPKKGKLWPPMIIMVCMLLIGTIVFVATRTTGPVTPWFTIEDGVLYYDDTLYTGSSVLQIPATVDGQTVEQIGPDSFRDCDTITEVILPDTVHTIQAGAFQDCDALVCVKFPESLVSIEENAFYGCGDLEAIYIPEAVQTIGQDAFSRCISLEHIFFVGDASDWKDLYPQTINAATQIYTVSGPDATGYTVAE